MDVVVVVVDVVAVENFVVHFAVELFVDFQTIFVDFQTIFDVVGLCNYSDFVVVVEQIVVVDVVAVENFVHFDVVAVAIENFVHFAVETVKLF